MSKVAKDRVAPIDDDESFELTPEMEAELEAANAEYERGEWIDGDEVLERLRSHQRAR